VSIFTTTYGEQRWRCHACGAGGTAIDLIMSTQGVAFRDAIELLANRAGVQPSLEPRMLKPAHIERPKSLAPGEVRPVVEAYMSACEAWLWSPRGMPMRRWLRARGFDEPIVRVNRLGADPGPMTLERAKGLPRGGAAIVLPVLGPDDRPTYLQARYLRPNGRRYDNPSADLFGSSPRFAETRLASTAKVLDAVLICEGLPDALTASQAGYRAVGVLGAALPDEQLAHRLHERFPQERLVLAFDADDSGQAGQTRLNDLLLHVGAGDRTTCLEVPRRWGDLNGWLQGSWQHFDAELDGALSRSSPDLGAALSGQAAPIDVAISPQPAAIDISP
jgi:hypothetical protein